MNDDKAAVHDIRTGANLKNPHRKVSSSKSYVAAEKL